MTPENKKTNIKEELARAEESLTSAEVLFKHGQLADAVSRLYYYVYHAVRALLLSKGLEPKSHEGMERLLGMHFIKPGVFPTGATHTFARLMKYREQADYNPSYVFTKDDYVQFKKDAEALHKSIVRFLKKEGLA